MSKPYQGEVENEVSGSDNVCVCVCGGGSECVCLWWDEVSYVTKQFLRLKGSSLAAALAMHNHIKTHR